MIPLTHRTRQQVYVNEDLIETMEANPDTILTLLGGDKVFVIESTDEVLERIANARRAGSARPRLVPLRVPPSATNKPEIGHPK